MKDMNRKILNGNFINFNLYGKRFFAMCPFQKTSKNQKKETFRGDPTMNVAGRISEVKCLLPGYLKFLHSLHAFIDRPIYVSI